MRVKKPVLASLVVQLASLAFRALFWAWRMLQGWYAVFEDPLHFWLLVLLVYLGGLIGGLVWIAHLLLEAKS